MCCIRSLSGTRAHPGDQIAYDVDGPRMKLTRQMHCSNTFVLTFFYKTFFNHSSTQNACLIGFISRTAYLKVLCFRLTVQQLGSVEPCMSQLKNEETALSQRV